MSERARPAGFGACDAADVAAEIANLVCPSNTGRWHPSRSDDPLRPPAFVVVCDGRQFAVVVTDLPEAVRYAEDAGDLTLTFEVKP